jgi:hypothetical protein
MRIELAALVAATLLGCQSSGGTVEVGLALSGQPLTAVAASSDAGSGTDIDGGAAPGPHLMLTVARVDVHVAGEGAPDDDHPGGLAGGSVNGPDDGGWVTVFAGAAHVDLLQVGSVETFLGSGATPSGKVTQIRLVLSDATWIDGAAAAPVTCPSCSQTGLKIVTMGKLFVPSGGTLHVTLDFDREHSIRVGTDGVHLDPVIKIARADTR